MGAAGRQRVVEEFSVERMVGKIRAVYDALI
jgi:glycosyltransferase involved in cell wall biosynthesis